MLQRFINDEGGVVTVEYIILLAGTVGLWIVIANLMGPTLIDYRDAIEAETDAAEALIVELNAICPPAGV